MTLQADVVDGNFTVRHLVTDLNHRTTRVKDVTRISTMSQ